MPLAKIIFGLIGQGKNLKFQFMLLVLSVYFRTVAVGHPS